MMVFFVLLTLGFIFELGKNALTIDSRQTSSYNTVDNTKPHAFATTFLQRSSVFDLAETLNLFARELPNHKNLAEQGGFNSPKIHMVAERHRVMLRFMRNEISRQV
jgi:hypothetical protein